jgi:hypothetical protein
MHMAKRSYKNKKIESSVLSLWFVNDNAGTPVPANGNQTRYIDLSQVASLVNRRFYRQGINWVVKGLRFRTEPGFSGSVTLSKLPTTWVMSNSWEKGMRSWSKMIKEASDETPSVRPKFMDFKIYADSEHHQLGFIQNLLPFDSDINFAQAGEWDSSKYEVPAAVNVSSQGANSREIIAVGRNYPGASAITGLDAVSLVEGYASSRGLPDIKDPNAPRDASDADGTNPENWITALFNEGSQQDAQVIADLIGENNQAPYPFENGAFPFGGVGTWTDTQYPGGANQLPALQIHGNESVFTTNTNVNGDLFFPGGSFPCGLLKIRTQNDAASAHGWTLQIDLVPGNHRGYLCEPMTEM